MNHQNYKDYFQLLLNDVAKEITSIQEVTTNARTLPIGNLSGNTPSTIFTEWVKNAKDKEYLEAQLLKEEQQALTSFIDLYENA